MVTIEEIDDIINIENADRLQLAKLKGLNFQFVIPKDQYEIGEYVVYFPVDSVIPQTLIQILGLDGKLAGKDKNRVKTIKLRGVISQGIVAKFDTVFEYAKARYEINEGANPDPWEWTPGTDITDFTGVTKYEADDTYIPNGRSGGRAGWLKPLPANVSKYDIESCQRNMDIVNGHLMEQSVLITEKLEGSNFALSVNSDGIWTVCQRNYAIDPEKIENHLWVKLAYPLVAKALDIFQAAEGTINNVVFRGEVIGPSIQGNIYKLDKNEVRLFDIMIDGEYLNGSQFLDFCLTYDLPSVPVLYGGLLHKFINRNGANSVVEASNGHSELNQQVLREGIVIRPIHREQHIDRFGRLILKVRSPQYLAGSDL